MPEQGAAAPRARRRSGALGKVHHVALIVRDLDEALGFWRDTLGLPVELVLPIETDRVTIAFLPGRGVQGGAGRADRRHHGRRAVPRARRARGSTTSASRSRTSSETLTRLELDGLELIDTAPRKGAEGPVAFIHPRSCHGVLVELIEAPGGPSWAALGYPAG